MVDIDQCYAILEIAPGAPLEEVKAAYRDLMKVWHPDRFSKDLRLQEKALERTKSINEAYQTLQAYVGLGPEKPGRKPERKPERKPKQKPKQKDKAGDEDKYRNSIGMGFAFIRPGVFTMGSPETEGEDDEHPRHKVRITKAFLMAVTPVTQAQWAAVMDSEPSHFRGNDLPVENVSWNDAKRFARELGRMDGGNYRLPTEAEWEYACRAKSLTSYYFGNDENKLHEYAWFFENSGMQTHPVGWKKSNAFDLHDMYGNVWEWCEDWYGEKYYKSSPINKPRGPTSGRHRVIRGGSWSLGASMLRSAYRIGAQPENKSRLVGFRCIKDTR